MGREAAELAVEVDAEPETLDAAAAVVVDPAAATIEN